MLNASSLRRIYGDRVSANAAGEMTMMLLI